ncbi:MAG TPA: A/G-specific adenine glycosylase [Polyangia bacterium]|nr:A/G-specific adenine glycosylase [Polyangia bacterium]
MPAISGPLLRWYDREKRDLPWRRQTSAYRTLVSELMAQQTTLAVVVPYFERFMTRFPTLEALAGAGQDQVMALWSGLGYYARARNLHRAAAAAVAEHGGRLPETEEALRRLPGVGPYTAAAVASIAFGERTFALDGNGARVMARLHGVEDPIDRPATRARLRELGTAEVPEQRPGDFTQAVMELGALVCTPRNPRCDVCPLAGACAARARGLTDAIPLRSPRAARPVVRLACACVTDGARVLLVKRAGGLLEGTWALPERQVPSAQGPAAARGMAAELGLRAAAVDRRGVVRQIFTHRDVRATVFRVQVTDAGRPAGARWVSPARLQDVGLSSFTRKTIAVGFAAAPRQKRDKAAPRP